MTAPDDFPKGKSGGCVWFFMSGEDVFEKSPQVTPLLVRLYDSHKLYGLLKGGDAKARAELTGAVADLLEADLSAREQELLADVLLGLMRQAERDLRQALAERMAAMKSAPLRLVLFLANDEIEVAAPVLRQSSVLGDLDLVYIIKSQGADYWRAIAAREKLSPRVIDLLADTRDAGTALALTMNDRIVLTEHALAILAEQARSSDALARPLLLRPELPESMVRALYRHVGAELKAFIRSRFGIGDGETADAIEDIVLEFADIVKPPELEFMPTEDMLALADDYGRAGLLNSQIMMESLDRGHIAEFIAFFAKYAEVPARRIHDALKQRAPRGIAILCRALGVQKSDFSRIYLATYRMRSNERTVNHKDMLDILSYFDKIRPEAAQRIVRGAMH